VPLNNGDIDRQEEKKVVIDTMGNAVVEPQPNVIKGTVYDDNGKDAIAQSSPIDVTNCEQCEIKDTRIRELEELVIKTTKITPANEIAEDKDNKIKQLQQELDERTRELDVVKHFRELQTEVYKDENHNTSNIAVTNTGDFEFSLLLGDIKYHLAALYPRIGDAGKVWFSGKFDKDSGKIHSISFGTIGDNV
jgi:aconitase A